MHTLKDRCCKHDWTFITNFKYPDEDGWTLQTLNILHKRKIKDK